jgi:hypothetical protein
MGSATLIKAWLSASAATIRETYLKKPIGKGNVSVAEIHITGDVVFCVGGTSRGGNKSPIPKPKPKSEGGQFQPTVDSRTHRLMDTDAEYKVLSTMFLKSLPDKELIIEENNSYGEEYIAKLKTACDNFLQKQSFQVGQIVKWKEHLNNRKIPYKNQPAMLLS